MVSLFALLIFVAIGGCSDGDRRTVSDQPRSVPQPSAATLENCRAMYPTQPDLEQACIRRWTIGEAIPGPSTSPLQSDAEKVRVLTQWCSGLSGIPPVSRESHSITPAQLRKLTDCVDEGLQRLTTSGQLAPAH